MDVINNRFIISSSMSFSNPFLIPISYRAFDSVLKLSCDLPRRPFPGLQA